MKKKSRKKRLIALDFDGVICHSAPEMGSSCFDVATDLVADKISMCSEQRTAFLEFFETVRPFLEVGYQGILVALWFISPSIRETVPLPTANVGPAWEEFLSAVISKVAARYPENFPAEGRYDAALTAMLGKRRDALLSADPLEWVKLNPLYDGIPELLLRILSDERNLVSIVSTKQTRFIHAILDHARIKIDPTFIFGLEAGRKESVIESLLESHTPDYSYFIEDRIETLRRFAQNPRFNGLILVFATWGYATPNQQSTVHEDSRIIPVTRISFAEMLSSP
jgi:phosphoglycolate phosphatase-like HAD superfamily hydrolase